MNIWVIGRNYPVPNNKMCGSFEFEQARIISSKGNKVSYLACIFHPVYKAKKWGYCHWNENNMGIFTYSQFYFPQRFKFYCDSFKKRIWNRFLANVEKSTGMPDIIHIHFPTMITLPDVLLEYKKKGVKIIVTEHWTNVQTGKLTAHEIKQLKDYVDRSDEFICVGKPLADSIKKITGTNRDIHIIPNVVSPFFKPSIKSKEHFRFVAAGRLVTVKQFDKIVKAFYKNFKGDPRVELTIIGGGAQYHKLKRIINEFKIDNQVKLTGALDRKKTAKFISESNVLICYSKLETFGVPVIEAWACGIPAIATEAIGFHELWDDRLGIIVNSNDIHSLECAMKKTYESYNAYSEEIIIEYAKNHFSEDAVYSKLIELYRRN